MIQEFSQEAQGGYLTPEEMRYPVEEQQVLTALRYLAECCDGASHKDHSGFNRFDAGFGKELAYSDRRLTAKQLLAARKMLNRYQPKQLSPAGILLPEDEAVQAVAQRKEIQYMAMKQQYDAPTDYNTGSAARVIGIRDGMIGVMFPPATSDFQDNLRRIKAIQREVEGLRLLNPTMDRVAFVEDNHNGKAFKYWQCPLELAERMVQMFPNLNPTLDVLRVINAEVERKAAEQRKIDEAQRLHRERVERLLGALGDLDAPIGDRVLYAHQREAVQTMLEWGSGIIAYEMGTGKTIVGGVIGLAYKKSEGCRVIIVGPKTLRSNWVEEAGHIQCPIEYYTHDSIPTDIPGKFVLIIDEADYFQNMRAQRTKKFIELAHKAEAVFPMTGTPARNGRPSGVYPLLLAVKNPELYAELIDGTPAEDQIKKSRKKYEARYCAATATEYSAWDTTGAAYLEEYHRKFVGTPRGILRKLKKDCLDLPEKIRKLIQVNLTQDEIKAFEAELKRLWDEHETRVAEKIETFKAERLPGLLEEEIKAWLRKTLNKKRIDNLEEVLKQVPAKDLEGFKIKTTKLLLQEERQRLASGDALVAMGHYRHVASQTKLQAADNIILELLEEEDAQVVVFCEFKDVAQEIANRHGVPVLSGDTPQKQREKIVTDFQAGETRIFVGIYGAGGVGITLTRAAHCILIGRPFTPGTAYQAEDRIHRISQQKTVVIQWLQIPVDVNDVDDKMDRMLQSKQKNISTMFDGAKEGEHNPNALDFTQKEVLDLFYRATHFKAGKEVEAEL
jgi:superfamily II DNA or RNA helicase